jgi:putative transposase
MIIQENQVQFFTATILEWKHLLQPDKYKQIITNSLRFLVQENKVIVYGFVIMPNHIHLLWQIGAGWKRENIQRDFLKFTAREIIMDLEANHPQELFAFASEATDRKYQIWERNSLSVDIFTPAVFWQKLNYIHLNPVQEKWKLCELPEDYYFSSARFYLLNETDFSFLTYSTF